MLLNPVNQHQFYLRKHCAVVALKDLFNDWANNILVDCDLGGIWPKYFVESESLCSSYFFLLHLHFTLACMAFNYICWASFFFYCIPGPFMGQEGQQTALNCVPAGGITLTCTWRPLEYSFPGVSCLWFLENPSCLELFPPKFEYFIADRKQCACARRSRDVVRWKN